MVVEVTVGVGKMVGVAVGVGVKVIVGAGVAVGSGEGVLVAVSRAVVEMAICVDGLDVQADKRSNNKKIYKDVAFIRYSSQTYSSKQVESVYV